jgi:hypothetical protein
LKLFSITHHIGIADLASVFTQLDHQLDFWSLSDHNHIMNWPTPHPDLLDRNSWRNISPAMCDAFYERYKSELGEYDVFITYYSPAMGMLFERFEKPIIMYIPLRYSTGLEIDPVRWKWFNDWIARMIPTGRVRFVVNNLYDQHYFHYHTGQHAALIPSLCDYTGAKYTGQYDKHIFLSKFHDFLNFIKVPNLVDKRTILNYQWQDMANFKSMVYLPYSNSNISVFENYTAGIPMLFPTFSLLKQLWKSYQNDGIMSELSWLQILGKDPTGLPVDDPNNYRSEVAFDKWVPLSDFYDTERLPHIQHYESIGELEEKLYTLNFAEISAMMLNAGEERKKRILTQWAEVLDCVSY